MDQWTIRRMTIGDYDEAMDLWERAGLDNIRKLGRDSPKIHCLHHSLPRNRAQKGL